MSTDCRPKTIFSDIDGVLFAHCGDILKQATTIPQVLPGVLDRFREWDRAGYRIILVSGRRESMREDTEHQLRVAGIIYDELIMGVGGGVRVLINDRKPGGTEDTAIAVNLERNAGLEGVKI